MFEHGKSLIAKALSQFDKILATLRKGIELCQAEREENRHLGVSR